MIKRPLIYAGAAERLFAYLIDSMILIVPTAIIASILGGQSAALIVSFLCSLAYFTYFISSPWQATPGNRLLSIYVARTDYHTLTPRDAVERFLAYLIPSLPLYTSLLSQQVSIMLTFWLTLFWFTPILFTSERVGYHDRLCNTRVLVGKVGT
jgi:uncharacterized RDD family membrane protein YckC